MGQKNAKSIDNAIKKQKKENVRKVKLLLYGTGECGKTTIARQMRMVHGDQLPEKKGFKGLICLNVIEGAALTVQAGRLQFKLPFENNESADLVVKEYRRLKTIENFREQLTLTMDLVAAITALYMDPEFHEALSRRNEYQIHDGWDYFAQKLTNDPGWPAWGGPDWNPSEEDLLYSRIRTTGKIVLDFEIGGTAYQLIDVGGQQSERTKFFHLFSQMDAVLYVASLSEYNQTLFEDNTRNRLVETLTVWGQTVNHKDFNNTWFILFLNKKDLFVEKYYRQKIPLKPEFKVTTPAPTVEEEEDERCQKALDWFEDLFITQAKKEKRQQVRVYVTTAMDRQDIKKVMDYCTTLLIHHGVGTNAV